MGGDVVAGRAKFGILVCTTGIGISIAANKMRGAADWADRLGREINNIPDAHTVSIYRRVVEAHITAYRTIYNAQGNNVRDALDDILGRAKGGPVRKGMPYIVGEQGRELFVPEASGHIVKASDTARLMRGQGGSAVPSGGGTTINVTITGALDPVAVGRQVRESLLTYQRTLGGRTLGLT